MNPDFKDAWESQSSQPRLAVDGDSVLQEVRRNQQQFESTILWRDVREMGVSLVMVPVWIFLGIRNSLPWTWYLTVPALIWIFVFMLVDRVRHKQQLSELGASLVQHLENSLSDVQHQIWLLRNVFWWYLLPIAMGMFAFIIQVFWNSPSDGWLGGLVAVIVLAVVTAALYAVYKLNQSAVRNTLEPRRKELETLLASLKDATNE